MIWGIAGLAASGRPTWAREGRVFDRLTSEAQFVVQGARVAARRLRHGRVGEHHLLLGIIEEGSAFEDQGILKDLRVDREALRRSVESQHPPGEAVLPAPNDQLTDFTRAGLNAVSRATNQAEFFGDERVGIDHLLVGLAEADELRAAGVTYDTIRARLARRPRVGVAGAIQDPGARPCVRHEDQFARFTCPRCGDFACASCIDEVSQLCRTCQLVPPPPLPSRGIALYLAIVFAALSGVYLCGLAVLFLTLVKSPSAGSTGIVAWNSIIGLVYFWIAFLLWKRSFRGYRLSLGTQGLNGLLAGFQLFTNLDGGTFLKVILGFQLAVNVLGYLATRAAKDEFRPD
jgi:hypothetical protein